MNKKAMFKIGYGLYVLTAKEDDFNNGCIINTVSQVTSTPNRISIAVNKDNFTHDMIMESGRFNISILSEKANFETFQHFGFQSGRDVDKFADCQFPVDERGIPYMDSRAEEQQISLTGIRPASEAATVFTI